MYQHRVTFFNKLSLLHDCVLPSKLSLPDDCRCPSREAAKERSPRRKPWVEIGRPASSEGAKEPPPRRRRQGRHTCVLSAMLMAVVLTASSATVTKPHVITFGKWMTVDWIAGTQDAK